MSNKRYPEEFKIEAVKQIAENHYPIAEVSNDWAFRNTACMSG